MRKPSKKLLRELLVKLEAAHAKEFPKVRKMSDVSRMAKRNWARYLRWDANQKQIASLREQINEKSPAKGARLGSGSLCARRPRSKADNPQDNVIHMEIN